MGLEIVRISPELTNCGYVAARHSLIRGIIEVTAPCGCVLSVNSRAETLLTLCQRGGCQFEWAPAIEAIKALEAMEASRPIEIQGAS